MVTVSGIGSGLDTASIISQLVALEQQRISQVAARGNKENTALSSWSTIRGTLDSLSSASQLLLKATDWQALTATSSNESIATVSAGSGTMTGSLAFTVGALAQTGVLRSANTLTSLSTRVTTDSAILVASGGAKLGFASLASNDSVSLGAHSIMVTQSSAGALKTGTAALGASTVIDNTNNNLQVAVNGTAYNLMLASGTYDAQQLATAVQDAINTAGAPASVATAANGALTIATRSEGSAATLRVTGGNALTALHLTTDAAALHGTDGQLTVDGGAAQTFGNTSTLSAGTTINLAAGAGTISAALSGGLRVGTLATTNVSTGDGSLATLVSAINAANAGVTAAAIQVGTGAYRLQIGSTNSGQNNDPNIAASELDSTAVGGLTVLSQGTDASITVGSGAGAYAITSSSNTMTDVLPGVTVTLLQQSSAPVTVTVGRNGDGLAANVQTIVDAANAVKTQLDKQTFFDPTSKTASPLTGDLTVDRLRGALYNAMSGIVAGATPTSPGLIGVSTDKDGNYTFDKTKFLTAYAANPDGVARIFGQFGSSTSGSVSLVAASSNTHAGTYALNITTAATQATSTSAGVPAVGTTIRARIGSVLAAYTVQAGDTASTVAGGLNTAFAAQNLDLIASVSGANVQIQTSRYGSQASMDVAWNGATYATSSGVDVAGTINGVAATGFGQVLTAPSSDPTLAGLAIKVVGTTTGAIGTMTYSPGIAARLDQSIVAATDSFSGYITATENGHKDSAKLVDDQVTRMTQSVSDYQERLKAQYARLEATLAAIKNQGSFLSATIAGLG